MAANSLWSRETALTYSTRELWVLLEGRGSSPEAPRELRVYLKYPERKLELTGAARRAFSLSHVLPANRSIPMARSAGLEPATF